MKFETIETRGIVLVGCGRMGAALLKGWLQAGINARSITVLTPNPPVDLSERGLNFNTPLPVSPAVVVLAVKPQTMAKIVPDLQCFGNGSTLILSIAAGTPIDYFHGAFGEATPIIRTMPNTPVIIGKGMTAMIGNAHVETAMLDIAEALMQAVGDVVHLEDEAAIDVVTAVSGSGPAYVFYMIEALAAAAEAQGLSPRLALQLARSTIAGAGALAIESGESPTRLRENVTSPGGTTAAALSVLMDKSTGLAPLISNTVAAAANKSRDLARAFAFVETV